MFSVCRDFYEGWRDGEGMIQKMFAVYDLKAVAYLQPFFSCNPGSAVRAFGDAVRDGKSPLSIHPEDYQLFELGTFDDNSGVLVGLVTAKWLSSGVDHVSGVARGPEKVDYKPVCDPEDAPVVTSKKK